jgi:hypothetical protein
MRGLKAAGRSVAHEPTEQVTASCQEPPWAVPNFLIHLMSGSHPKAPPNSVKHPDHSA